MSRLVAGEQGEGIAGRGRPTAGGVGHVWGSEELADVARMWWEA